MAIRFIPGTAKKKWLLWFPPVILAVNILEAVIRDFQAFSFGAFAGANIDAYDDGFFHLLLQSIKRCMQELQADESRCEIFLL